MQGKTNSRRWQPVKGDKAAGDARKEHAKQKSREVSVGRVVLWQGSYCTLMLSIFHRSHVLLIIPMGNVCAGDPSSSVLLCCSTCSHAAWGGVGGWMHGEAALPATSPADLMDLSVVNKTWFSKASGWEWSLFEGERMLQPCSKAGKPWGCEQVTSQSLREGQPQFREKR